MMMAEVTMMTVTVAVKKEMQTAMKIFFTPKVETRILSESSLS